MTAAIDAHCHVWSLDDGERFPLREKIAALARDFTIEELAALQRRCGVAGAVLVQAVDSTRESGRLLALARDDERVLGVVAWADPTRADFPEVVQRYRAMPKFAGIRPMPHDIFGADWLRSPGTRRAFEYLQGIGCPVDLLVKEADLSLLADVLPDFGPLRCVLDHGGRPAVMTGDTRAWQRHMRRLAGCASLSVKCSGLVERAGVEWTKDTIRPWIGTLLDSFGDARVLFASNWPVMTLACRYDLWVETVGSILVELGLAAEAIDRVMRLNAAAFYRLGRTDG